MRFGNLATSVAALGMVLAPVAAHAAEAVAGTVAVGQGDVLVARGGELLRATPNMTLYTGDRVMTRAGGTARVSLASGCTTNVAPSSMATVGSAGCASVTGFDSGRAAYAGRASAFDGGGNVFIIVAGLLAAAAGVYFAVHNNHNRASP